MLRNNPTGSDIYLLYYMHTAPPSTPLLAIPTLCSCMAVSLYSLPSLKSTAFDATSYPAHLCSKLAELKDFVDSNLAAAASHQKANYDQHTSSPNFSVGDSVWLSVPTAGKLDPRWEGRWRIKAIKSSVNMEISDGTRTKVPYGRKIWRGI